VRVLLDTHALLWWVAGDAQLSPRAKRTIADRRHEIIVSAASAWEVTAKHRIGKLPGAGPLAVDFPRVVRTQGFTPLPITLSHAQVAGALPGDHRDPFDRMLIAQAREDRLALISIESLFDDYGVSRIW
jgi:PIN domain nuclease of toxin-antitoxin system